MGDPVVLGRVDRTMSDDTEVSVSAPEGESLRVNELYDRLTVQGEGPHVGRLCTFVRLYGCNLHCRWCDTPYTWDVDGRNGEAFPRAENTTTYLLDEVVAHVLDLGAPMVVVTGGEPMLQARSVLALARRLADHRVEVHVETNGTRPPAIDWTADPVAHYSVSPKLPSAGAGPNALLVDHLRAWARHPGAIFKVVCGNAGEVAEASALFDLCDVEPHARWIMPEGRTPGQVDASLARIADAAIAHRANLSPRLHVQVWGTMRGR